MEACADAEPGNSCISLANGNYSKEKFILRHKLVRYFYRIDAIMFTVLSAITGARFDHASPIVIEDTLFGYVIYSPADLHCQQCRSAGE